MTTARKAMRTPPSSVLSRKLRLAGAAVRAIGDGIDKALTMDYEESSLQVLDAQLSQARELLRWAVGEKS